jgi:hypothetical protein
MDKRAGRQQGGTMVTCCDRDGLLRIRAWRRHHIHIGLSPRVSPLWEGLFCGESGTADDITDYAHLFDTALIRIGPRLLHQWNTMPDEATFVHLQNEGDADFRWTVIVEDEHMMYRFPYGYPDRKRQGEMNPGFLDPRSMHATLLPILHRLTSRIIAIMLNIGPIARTEKLSPATLHEKLFRCLDTLSASLQMHRLAVALPGPEFIVPEYLAHIRRRKIIHVPAGQPLIDAFSMPDVLTSDLCVLQSDCLVDQEEGEEWIGFRQAVRCCLENQTKLYAYLGDGSESIATGEPAEAFRSAGPARLTRLLSGLDADLARRSPIRQKAA